MDNTFSVSDIINFFFGKGYSKNNKRNKILGIQFHKMANLRFILQEKFDIDFYIKQNVFYSKEQVKSLYKILDIFLRNKEYSWSIIEHEFIISYKKLFGTIDILFEKKKNFIYNNNLPIYSGIINKRILEEKIIKRKKKKEIVIVDWKCSRNNDIFREYRGFDPFLFNYMKKTFYNKCLLQLNLYYYILKKNNKDVDDMYIFLINPETLKYNLIPIPFLKISFIETLIDYFNNKKWNLPPKTFGLF